MHPTGLASGQKCRIIPPRRCALAGPVTILCPFRLSLSSSPMCWEWPGSVCLVSLRCPCLCSTTYGQLVKSSSHPRPTGQPVWSRSAWISDNTVLPFNPPLMFMLSCVSVHLNYYMDHFLIIMLSFIPFPLEWKDH